MKDHIEDRVHFVPHSKRKKEGVLELIIEELDKNSEITTQTFKNETVYSLKTTKHIIYNKIMKNNPGLKFSKSHFYKLCPKNYR